MQLEKFWHSWWLAFLCLCWQKRQRSLFVFTTWLRLRNPKTSWAWSWSDPGEEECPGGGSTCGVCQEIRQESSNSLLAFLVGPYAVFLIACTIIHAFCNIQAHSTAAQRGIRSSRTPAAWSRVLHDCFQTQPEAQATAQKKRGIGKSPSQALPI